MILIGTIPDFQSFVKIPTKSSHNLMYPATLCKLQSNFLSFVFSPTLSSILLTHSLTLYLSLPLSLSLSLTLSLSLSPSLSLSLPLSLSLSPLSLPPSLSLSPPSPSLSLPPSPSLSLSPSLPPSLPLSLSPSLYQLWQTPANKQWPGSARAHEAFGDRHLVTTHNETVPPFK